MCASCHRCSSPRSDLGAGGLQAQLEQRHVLVGLLADVAGDLRRHRGGPVACGQRARGEVEHEPLEPLGLLVRGEQQRLLQQLVLGGEVVGGGRQRDAGLGGHRPVGHRVGAVGADHAQGRAQDLLPAALTLLVHSCRQTGTKVPPCPQPLCRPRRTRSTTSPTRTSTGAGRSATGVRWRSTSRRDAEQWQTDFTDLERKAAYWNYCLFFWGEDAVADGLSPYVDAAPLEEQKYFLTTQQVDEARHAVFFNRFMKEVVGVGGDSVADSLHAIKPELTWGFTKIFDRLVDDVRRAAPGPVDPEAGGGGHALPRGDRGHARPARPALHHQLPHRPRAAARLPRGHGEGGGRRAAPHRVRREAAVGPAPDGPGGAARGRGAAARGDPLHGLGPDPARTGTCATSSASGSRWRTSARRARCRWRPRCGSAGLPIDELPGPPVFPVPGTARERAARGHKMVRAGYLGEKLGPPSQDPARHGHASSRPSPAASDAAAAAEPGVIQWEFRDARSPGTWSWPTATRAPSAGRRHSPRVTFKSSFEDFVDVAAGAGPPQAGAARTDALPGRPALAVGRGMFPG